jgi:UDP-glucose 4-epimerase
MGLLHVGITGASGFIGRELVPRLLSHPEIASIRVLFRNPLDEQVILSKPPLYDICIGDLHSPSDCASFCKGLDVIIHLAHSGTPLTSVRDLASNAHYNLVLSLNLIHAVHEEARGCHVIFASSGGTVYGKPASDTPLPFRENAPCAPFSFHGIQKLSVEHYLRVAAESGWLQCTILRITNPYGVPLPLHRKQGVIGIAMQRAVQGLPILIYGNLANVRDYIHIEDVIQAFILALRPTQPYQIYNISSGIGVSLVELFSAIERITGLSLVLQPIDTDNTSTQLVPWVVTDPGLAHQQLGWKAQMTLEEGIKKLYDRIKS